MNKSNSQASDDNMCKSCMLFYGCEAYQWLCSSCYKYQPLLFRKNQPAKKEEISLKEAEAEIIATEPCRKETVDTIEEIN